MPCRMSFLFSLSTILKQKFVCSLVQRKEILQFHARHIFLYAITYSNIKQTCFTCKIPKIKILIKKPLHTQTTFQITFQNKDADFFSTNNPLHRSRSAGSKTQNDENLTKTRGIKRKINHRSTPPLWYMGGTPLPTNRKRAQDVR